MKFVNYRYKKHSTKHLGILTRDEKFVLNIAKILGDEYPKFDMISFLNYDYEKILPTLQDALEKEEDKIDVERVDFLSPIEKPIHDIICVGENYHAHKEESSKFLDEEFLKTRKAIYFGKRINKILGNEETIEARFDLDEKLDYEVELGIIIGKTGKNISKENARDYIFGFTIINDLSYRDIQVAHHQWYRGKSLDGLTTMGPCIVTKDEFSFPIELNLSTKVDEEIRQNSNTSFLITKIEDMICELSNGMTLEAGDIISTGTPSGVGAGFTPPKFLKKGQKIECTVEKIGTLINYVK